MELEHEVQCPSCWESNRISLDPVEGVQTFVEDCWVCCRPMTVRCVVEDEALVAVEVEPAD